MSTATLNAGLLEPLAGERPCGTDLDEDLVLLAPLESWRIFGESRSPEAPPDEYDRRKPIVWSEVQAQALVALAASKDLRPLAYLGTALLRTDAEPLRAFADVISVAHDWLNHLWAGVYPQVGETGLARRNALNCLADPMAVVDRIRRVPLVANRHGRFTLRDVEMASGKLTPSEGEARPEPERVRAAFDQAPLEELIALQQRVAAAIAALRAIDERMRVEIDTEAAPTFDPLLTQLGHIDRELRARVAARQPAGDQAASVRSPGDGVTEVVAAGPGTAPGVGGGIAVPGAVRSRADAIRALDAVAAFFRETEPSSPVPLLVERARRLVAKDFLAVLEDVAPDALAAVRALGGIKADQDG